MNETGTDGKTEGTAIREAHDAIAAWIKAAKSMKRAVPAPSKPADEMAYSGKFLMRVPKCASALNNSRRTGSRRPERRG